MTIKNAGIKIERNVAKKGTGLAVLTKERGSTISRSSHTKWIPQIMPIYQNKTIKNKKRLE
jgi:hypothetical protein